MNILVADKFEDSGLTALKTQGCEISFLPDLKDDALAQELAKKTADVLIVRSTQVTSDMMTGSRLSLIIRAGAGYNTIDVACASRLGIYVANCPGKNAIAVAELTMGLILSLDRRLPDNVSDLRSKKWNKKTYSQADGLFGKTLGVIGFGRIGQEVAYRANSFGLRTLAWSRSLTPQMAQSYGAEHRASPIEVASQSDIVSVHVAATTETTHLINRDFLSKLKPGAMLINTSRSSVVDESALREAITEKGIRVGLDVFDGEPASGSGEVQTDLFELEGIIGTHHIGASTEQAQAAIADEAVRIVSVYQATGKPPNVVNIAERSPATNLLVVRHHDRIGVLASVFDALKRGAINVQETENIVFAGAEAAVARIYVDHSIPPEIMDDMRQGSDDILDIAQVTL